MSYFQRFMWGLLAGVAVVIVKMLGPDSIVIKEFLTSFNRGGIAFYAVISVLTVILGGISGLFAKGTEPTQILVFCAAFPALVTTASTPERVAPNSDLPNTTAQISPFDPPAVGWNLKLVSSAMAQQTQEGKNLVCDEGSFTQQFTNAAKSYFSNQLQTDNYAVVIGSVQDFDQAKVMADRYARQSGRYNVYVGCRKPGNPYFPIIVGNSGNLQTAAEIKGEIIGEGWAPEDTYFSNYAYRTLIYDAGKK